MGSYADAELVGLVEAAAEMLQIAPGDVLRWFGREAMPRLAERFPVFFDGASGLRGFVLSLNSIIHAEVRKLYPGAECPVFEFRIEEDGALEIIYRSPRKMCALIEGFMAGAATHFDEAITMTQHECMHDGADACVFSLAQATAGARLSADAPG